MRIAKGSSDFTLDFPDFPVFFIVASTLESVLNIGRVAGAMYLYSLSESKKDYPPTSTAISIPIKSNEIIAMYAHDTTVKNINLKYIKVPDWVNEFFQKDHSNLSTDYIKAQLLHEDENF